MTFRDRTRNSLDDIASELLHPEDFGPDQLPSVDGVIAIAADIRELLFPGYRKLRRPQSSDQTLEYRSLLNRLQSRLTVEVGRALTHAEDTTLRIHAEGGHAEPNQRRSAADLTAEFLRELPGLKCRLRNDVAAAFDSDPAAKGAEEIVLCYPGIDAVMIYRVAHQLHLQGVPYLPRILSEWAHRETGIDIHPGATIGPYFFIDHGTGVVIGETCEIGSNVTLYQGVTLGARSFPRDGEGNLIRGTKRHPTLEDGVRVYSNASILGGSTTVGTGAQIGSGVTLSRSVPPNTIVTIEKPSLRFREAG